MQGNASDRHAEQSPDSLLRFHRNASEESTVKVASRLTMAGQTGCRLLSVIDKTNKWIGVMVRVVSSGD